jgi:hypothetical protein
MAWSATTAAATVAIIALGAGFLLSNAPRQPQVADQTASAASSPSPAASIVPAGDRTVLATGTIGTPCRSFGKAETEDWTPDLVFQHHEDDTRGRECPITMTEPRLTGTLTTTGLSSDTFGRPNPSFGRPNASGDPDGLPFLFEGEVTWGTWLLTAPNGTWEGDFTGSSISDGNVTTGWLRGTGAYEGLSAWFQVVAAADRPLIEDVVNAMIFPGDPPPNRCRLEPEPGPACSPSGA